MKPDETWLVMNCLQQQFERVRWTGEMIRLYRMVIEPLEFLTTLEAVRTFLERGRAPLPLELKERVEDLMYAQAQGTPYKVTKNARHVLRLITGSKAA